MNQTTTLETLYEALESQSLAEINAQVAELHPAEIANFLESLPPKQRSQLWQQSEIDQGAILPYVNEAVRIELMENMSPLKVATAAENMDVDDAVDLLQDLSDELVEEVLQAMDVQYRRRLTAVLFYPENSAGGLMNTDILTIRTEMTLKMVLRYLRRLDKLPEKTDALMVVDCNNYYRGVLWITDLLTHSPRLLVEQITSTDIEAIPAQLPAHEVARLFEQRDLLSAPVIDKRGMLVGRITIDDVVDVIRAEADHNLMVPAGLDKDDDMFAPILATLRDRSVWLGINLGTAFLAAWVIGLFAATLEKVVALAVLMPIVASMGGIAGSQTLTIVIRGMALGKVTATNAPWLLRKELAVSLLNGMMWAIVIALVAIIWFSNIKLGLIIGIAIIINLFGAALVGSLLPLILRRLSIDPALAGGVILTTVTDVVGFATFLGLATLFLLNPS
jgi:magnesium transporter